MTLLYIYTPEKHILWDVIHVISHFEYPLANKLKIKLRSRHDDIDFIDSDITIVYDTGYEDNIIKAFSIGKDDRIYWYEDEKNRYLYYNGDDINEGQAEDLLKEWLL